MIVVRTLGALLSAIIALTLAYWNVTVYLDNQAVFAFVPSQFTFDSHNLFFYLLAVIQMLLAVSIFFSRRGDFVFRLAQEGVLALMVTGNFFATYWLLENMCSTAGQCVTPTEGFNLLLLSYGIFLVCWPYLLMMSLFLFQDVEGTTKKQTASPPIRFKRPENVSSTTSQPTTLA
jgi:hypothetical protein